LVDKESAEAKLKYQLLLNRSKIRYKSKLKKVPPHEDDHPESGHYSARFTLASGYSDTFGRTVFLEQRFALHDALDRHSGYPKNGKIEFMNIGAEISEQKDLVIKYIDIVGVEAFTPITDYEKRRSWQMRFGIQEDQISLCKKCTNGFFEMGFGASLALDPYNNYILYGLITNVFEYSVKFQKEKHRYRVGPKIGLLLNFSSSTKLQMYALPMYFPFSDEQSVTLFNLEGRTSISKNQALGFRVDTVEREVSSRFSYHVYY
jgi:hypothetical protein